ncbi:hypothetical protein HYR69_06150 [Candidatus Sumerlaeota bacterium]|nr:hypothetical protein [Candidatus Sumerlaeota bacterium]MBI3736578.1 hypothetical protein [Candidatus Sumerlaeota bacterium]
MKNYIGVLTLGLGVAGSAALAASDGGSETHQPEIALKVESGKAEDAFLAALKSHSIAEKKDCCDAKKGTAPGAAHPDAHEHGSGDKKADAAKKGCCEGDKESCGEASAHARHPGGLASLDKPDNLREEMRKNSEEIQRRLAEVGELIKQQGVLMGELAGEEGSRLREKAETRRNELRGEAENLGRDFSDRMEKRLGDFRDSLDQFSQELRSRLKESEKGDRREKLEGLRKDFEGRMDKRFDEFRKRLDEARERIQERAGTQGEDHPLAQKAERFEEHMREGMNDLALKFAQTPEGREMAGKMMDWMRQRGEQVVRKLDDVQRQNEAARQTLEKLVARMNEFQSELEAKEARIKGLESAQSK